MGSIEKAARRVPFLVIIWLAMAFTLSITVVGWSGSISLALLAWVLTVAVGVVGLVIINEKQ